MKAPSNVPGMALPRVLQGSSDLPPSLHSSLVYAEARCLIRGDALQASPEEGALRYVCFPCRRSYSQPQGLKLHIRTVHNLNPNQCFLCEFKWARPYEYRNHLRKHPGVDPDSILGKPAGSRRRATIRTEQLPQQPSVSPPAVEQDQQNLAESQPNPSAPPSLAPARDTSVPPPAVSSVDYNSQPVYAEQIVTMDEHEYAHGSEVLDSTYPVAAAMLLSTEERAEPMNISVQDGQFGLPSAHVGGSTTHSASNPEMAPISTLSPSVGENYKDPMVGSFEPMLHFPLSEAEIDATYNSLFSSTF